MFRTKRFVIFGLAVFFILLLLVVFGGSSKSPKPPTPVSKTSEKRPSNLPSPFLEKGHFPYNQNGVNWSGISGKDFPSSLPSYRVLGSLTRPLAPDEADVLAQRVGFTVAARQVLPKDGSELLIYEQDGRVLSVETQAPSLAYSELPRGEATDSLPDFREAETRVRTILSPALEKLNEGWEIRVTKKIYLKDEGALKKVVARESADVTGISFDFYYRGLRFITLVTLGEPIEAFFDRSGALTKFRLSFWINNEAGRVEGLVKIKAKGLEEIKNSFRLGEARVVSLGLESVVSEEPLSTAPKFENVYEVEPLIFLRGSSLEPYYFLRSRGDLDSGESAAVFYLLPSETF